MRVIGFSAITVAALLSGATAQAEATFASFSSIGSDPNIEWKEAGNDHGGSLSTSSTATTTDMVTFSYADTTPFQAILSITGTSTDDASHATLGNETLLVQGGITGSFVVTNDSGHTKIIDGKSYAQGAPVLEGNFMDGQIDGLKNDTTSTIEDTIDIGAVTYTLSPYPWVTDSAASANGFSLAGTDVQPKLALSGASLRSFDGTFSGSFEAAPEPGAWAMMIIGVGAIGAALRSRRMRRPGTGRTAGAQRLAQGHDFAAASPQPVY